MAAFAGVAFVVFGAIVGQTWLAWYSLERPGLAFALSAHAASFALFVLGLTIVIRFAFRFRQPDFTMALVLSGGLGLGITTNWLLIRLPKWWTDRLRVLYKVPILIVQILGETPIYVICSLSHIPSVIRAVLRQLPPGPSYVEVHNVFWNMAYGGLISTTLWGRKAHWEERYEPGKPSFAGLVNTPTWIFGQQPPGGWEENVGMALFFRPTIYGFVFGHIAGFAGARIVPLIQVPRAQASQYLVAFVTALLAGFVGQTLIMYIGLLAIPKQRMMAMMSQPLINFIGRGLEPQTERDWSAAVTGLLQQSASLALSLTNGFVIGALALGASIRVASIAQSLIAYVLGQVLALVISRRLLAHGDDATVLAFAVVTGLVGVGLLVLVAYA